MPRRGTKDNRLGKHGNFWVSPRPRSPYWYLTWYDETKGRNIYESLGTADFDEAEAAVNQRWMESKQSDKPSVRDAFTLHGALDFYYKGWASKRPSKGEAERSIRYWKEFWPVSTTLDDMSDTQIDLFIESLEAKDWALGTVSRVLSVGRAALFYLKKKKKKLVLWVPDIRDPQTKRQKNAVKIKGRLLKLSEMARLYLCAGDLFHLQTFIIMMINTLGRTKAILELGPKNVHLDEDYVDLLAEGEAQTDKGRAAVPITKALRPIVEMEGVETFVNFKGEALGSIKKAWRTLVKKSGLPEPDRIKPYSIRHTLSQVIGKHVSNEMVGNYLGHGEETTSGRTTRIYNPRKAEHLEPASKFVEAYWDALQVEIAEQRKTFVMPLSAQGQRNDLRKQQQASIQAA